MKNILYLVRSTRTSLRRYPMVYVGSTNYLYRQLLIHNHRWNPKDRARQRQRIPETYRNEGWMPLAVVTGFPSTAMTEIFRLGFERAYAGMPHPDVFKSKRGELIDQLEYRQIQLGHVLNHLLGHFASLPSSSPPSELAQEQEKPSLPTLTELYALREVKPGAVQLDAETMRQVLAVRPGPMQLTVHWQDEESMARVSDAVHSFADGIQHRFHINVKAIDKKCFDRNDFEDDRNFERLKAQAVETRHLQRLGRLSKELGISMDQLPAVLNASRQSAIDHLSQRKGKVSKKAQERITMRPGPSGQVPSVQQVE